jgi:hypothetical protein
MGKRMNSSKTRMGGPGGPNPLAPKSPKPDAGAVLSDGQTRAAKPPKPGMAKPGGGLGALLGALGGGAPGAPMGGMSAPAKPRPPGLAIGQRPQLGGRTKAAMKPPMRGKRPMV